MLPTIKFRGLFLGCLTLVVIFSAPELASAPAPGETFRDCPNCPEMVVIPAGQFLMGDMDGGGQPRERPVHEVRIAKPFAMGRYEVTFAEYDRYARATGKTKPDDAGGGRGNRPVINVSWGDIKDYVLWLSKETGQRYRLPSEAEWEYAARAGSGEMPYFWGWSPSGRHANAAENHGWPSDGYEYTVPVGSFQPNQFGLYDMSGNVWEWVEDCWHSNYQGAPVDGSAWTWDSGGDCSKRVLRGGSFLNAPAWVRSAARGRDGAANRNSYLGFRLARTL